LKKWVKQQLDSQLTFLDSVLQRLRCTRLKLNISEEETITEANQHKKLKKVCATAGSPGVTDSVEKSQNFSVCISDLATRKSHAIPLVRCWRQDDLPEERDLL